MDELRVKDLNGHDTVLTFDGAIFEAFSEFVETRRFHVAVCTPEISVDKKGVVSIASRTPRSGKGAPLSFSEGDASNVLAFMEQVTEGARIARGASG